MKKKLIIVIGILSILFSCNKRSSIDNELKDHIVIKNKIDSIWNINNIKILEENKMEIVADFKNCKEIYIQYSIELVENCYENPSFLSTLENNIIVKEIKEIFSIDFFKTKIYQKNQCLSEKWIKDIYKKEEGKLRNNIGSKICDKYKSLLNNDCITYRIYTEEDFNEEKKQLGKKFLLETSMLKKHYKGEKEVKKESLIYCMDGEEIIFP